MFSILNPKCFLSLAEPAENAEKDEIDLWTEF
jgi:hypothetical protein